MEVLSSRVLYRSSNFDALRRFYEQIVGLHVYREYGPSEKVLGVVFWCRRAIVGTSLFALCTDGADQTPPEQGLCVDDSVLHDKVVGCTPA
jgi:hypothetical protein